MKSSIKTLLKLLLLMFLIPLCYLLYLVNHHKELLEEVSHPFIKECRSPRGCVIEPVGWRNDNDGKYYKDMMTYKATKEEFTIIKHIATDTHMVVTGGKNKPLSIEKFMDHEIDWKTYKVKD